MKSKLPAIHPGEFLAEILGEIGVSQAAFARAVGVSAMRVSHVVTGARPISADLALLYEKERQKGNVNRATLAVARKLVAYLLAVDRGEREFAPSEKHGRAAA